LHCTHGYANAPRRYVTHTLFKQLTNSPEKDGAVVPCRSVLAAPGKTFLPQAEILGHRKDGEGQSSNQCLPVALSHLSGAQPREPLIEIDVIRPVLMPCCWNSQLLAKKTVYFHATIKVCNKLVLTLVNLQLDTQNSYLFTYTTFIKILYMFRALPCSSSEGLRRNCIYIYIYIYM